MRPAPSGARLGDLPHQSDDNRKSTILIPAIAPDGTLYPIEKMAAHREGLLHLAVSVFVFCGNDLLIQRRAEGKYHCAGLWANTCCTHPNWNETPQSSAGRRLMEEMGVSLVLTQTALIEYAADVSYDMRECERVHVYRANADRHALVVAPNHQEVSETQWADVDVLKEDARAHPERYAPWFRIYLARWDELGF